MQHSKFDCVPTKSPTSVSGSLPSQLLPMATPAPDQTAAAGTDGVFVWETRERRTNPENGRTISRWFERLPAAPSIRFVLFLILVVNFVLCNIASLHAHHCDNLKL